MAAARRAGSPGAAQCKSSLTTRPSTPDGGVGAAAAHLGDDGVQPERACARTMMRASPEHIKGRVASNPHTMSTRENLKMASCAKTTGRRWTLLAVPVGAGGRPHSVGILVTSSFSWAGSGVLDGCEVGADRRKNRGAANDPSAANSPPTDMCLSLSTNNRVDLEDMATHQTGRFEHRAAGHSRE